MPSILQSDPDLEIARAAIRQTRREILSKLFALLAVEDNPNRRENITGTISRFLAQGKV
jgi:hypothetical protein